MGDPQFRKMLVAAAVVALAGALLLRASDDDIRDLGSIAFLIAGVLVVGGIWETTKRRAED